jgi:beta-lactamase class A
VKGDGYETTIGELLQRALTMSDNTCQRPAAALCRRARRQVRDFIRRKQLGDIRFGPGEKAAAERHRRPGVEARICVGNAFTRARAQAAPQSDARRGVRTLCRRSADGAAPMAIAGALAKLKRGELLSRQSTDYLIGTMQSSKTGKQRMRGAVPGAGASATRPAPARICRAHRRL